MHALTRHALLRNLFFYCLVLLIVAVANLGVIRELGMTSVEITEFLGFYTLIYGGCWVHNALCFNRYFAKGTYLTYSALVVGLVIVLTILLNIGNRNSTDSWFTNGLSSAIILVFGLGIQLIYRYVLVERQRLQTDLHNSRTEVWALKAQMNPHFLFNALNNLYALSVSEPERVPPHIEVISDMLRYQIDVSRKETIPLAEEIRFIRQYVCFEQLKLGKRGRIALHIQADESLFIAPMLLQPFVENAVKFGSRVSQPAITIQIMLTDHRLTFIVYNTVDPAPNTKPASTGIGIANTRRRLDLLFPDRYTLDIDEQPEQYRVHLTIDLP